MTYYMYVQSMNDDWYGRHYLPGDTTKKTH